MFSLLFLMPFTSFCQESKTFFFDEFNLSVNKVVLQGEENEGLFGFGLGAYHRFMDEKKLNLILGFEYNMTRQFIKSLYEGHSATAKDLTYTMNCLSIPLGLRFNMGKKTKLFIEGGGFADLMIYSKRTGTLCTYSYDAENHLIENKQPIDEKVSLSSGYGLYLGMGVQIPMSGFELIIKPDFKLGLKALYSYQESIYNSYIRLAIGLKLK